MHIAQLFFVTLISFVADSHIIMDVIYGLMMSIEISFFSLILLIGGLIIVTLSYVAWKKYKGQKLKHKKKIKGENK